ncbi:hypothetical protein T492DRAFT_849033 [Pavlovales sp. CCMP2436]|nr:hypothetical protein T492DRAFT_849033 [Pavlovales sp. CCMP2436]
MRWASVGHALGLGHSRDRDAVLSPYYNAQHTQLTQADVTRAGKLHSLYMELYPVIQSGTRSSHHSSPPPSSPPPHCHCPASSLSDTGVLYGHPATQATQAVQKGRALALAEQAGLAAAFTQVTALIRLIALLDQCLHSIPLPPPPPAADSSTSPLPFKHKHTQTQQRKFAQLRAQAGGTVLVSHLLLLLEQIAPVLAPGACLIRYLRARASGWAGFAVEAFVTRALSEFAGERKALASGSGSGIGGGIGIGIGNDNGAVEVEVLFEVHNRLVDLQRGDLVRARSTSGEVHN